MKKILKIVGITIGIIIFLMGSFAFYINQKGIPHYENKAPEITVKSDSMRIERGRKLAVLVCSQCHGGESSNVLEGKVMEENTPFGDIYAPNITKHLDKGIGKYTDGELLYLFRTGIKKNGQYAPPWMPKFPQMADEELYDIIAFLRSDHPLVQPSDKTTPLSQPSFLAKMLCNVAFKPFPYPEEKIKKPLISDQVNYGKYMANAVLQCYSCHSVDFKSNDDYDPEKSKGFYGGGNPIEEVDGKIMQSTNITFDKKTGIGNWTAEEFVKAVKWGVRPDNSPIQYPMTKFNLLEDEEVEAIYAYLKTIPTIENDVKN